jgi:hypothetical protein
MLYTHTATESRDRTLSAIIPTGVGLRGRADGVSERGNRRDAERAIDDVLADSFPASDPPSWNPGVTRPEPAVSLDHRAAQSARMAAGSGTTPAGVIDVSSRSREATFIDALISLAGVAGIALLVPLAILLIAMPVALTIRGLVDVTGWVFGIDVR